MKLYPDWTPQEEAGKKCKSCGTSWKNYDYAKLCEHEFLVSLISSIIIGLYIIINFKGVG